MKPFLLLSVRPEDDAAESERLAVARLAGLDADDLHTVRLASMALPDIDLSHYSGVFLGGGPFNASDAVKTQPQLQAEAEIGRVIDAALADDVAFLGLCYGIGALTHRLGGTVDRTYGEPAGVISVTLTPAGRGDPLFKGVPTTVKAFVGHKEAVHTLPAGAIVLATGDACPVQAFRIGRRVYATQFHPELDPEGMAQRLRIYQHHGYFDAAEVEQLVEEALAAPVTADIHRIVTNFVALAREQSPQSR